MNNAQQKRLETALKAIYNTWHNCALKTGNEVKNGKKGQLCDNCSDEIAFYLEYVKTGRKDYGNKKNR